MINLDETDSLDSANDVLIHTAARLEQLAARLRRVAAGQAPSLEELDAAPLADGWQISRREVPIVSTGVDTGPQVVTPDLYVVAPVSGWALSSAGWLALGDRQPVEYRPLFREQSVREA